VKAAALLTSLVLASTVACGRHDTPVASQPSLVASGGGGGGGEAEGGSGGLSGSGGNAPTLDCPATYTTVVPGLASRYREVMQGLPWVEAERDCELDGMHLIVVSDDVENAWLATVAARAVTNDSSTHQIVWLGASDSGSEGSFDWVTGGAAPASYWSTDEPNSLHDDEDCVEARTSGGWNDDRCNAPLAYVCECDGASSSSQWCDTSDALTCGDCSTTCADGETCVKQQCQ
jgi:hypothetical protein